MCRDCHIISDPPYSFADYHCAHSGLVVGTSSLSSTAQSSFAFDKPIYASIVCLTTLAAALLVLARLLPKGDTTPQKGQYLAVPLQETHEAPRDHSPHQIRDVPHPSSMRKLRILFVLLVLAICARAQLARQIVLNVQCAHATWEPVVPLVLAIWDWFSLRRRRRHDAHVDDQTATLYDIWESRIMNSPFRYLVAVSLVSLGSLGAMRALGSPSSTHICAASLPYSKIVPLSQYASLALDVLIAYCINELLHSDQGRGSRAPSTRFSAVGWAFLVSTGSSRKVKISADTR